ncbi:MAG: 4'-phosphopantetheinyl transferase family protein [Lachnospiraceae bacterium]
MYKIYLFSEPEKLDSAWLERAVKVLPPVRQQKALSYRCESDRKNCVITYLLLKAALKDCFGVRQFEIHTDHYGKPHLSDHPEIHFNLSHCKSGCAAAVSDHPIGIDIQELRPVSESVIRRVCCREEAEYLERSSDRELEFIKIWTKKESILKRIGTGIRSDMKRVNTLRKTCVETVVESGVVLSAAYQDTGGMR